MAQKNRSKELWLIPKRGSLHQTICLIDGVINRNYNGTSGFQAYEAQALRDFFVNHKSTNKQTILVDLHGWTQQLIGDAGICSYYEKQFPENDKSAVGRYGNQYMILFFHHNH